MPTIGFRFLSWNLDNFGKFNYSGTMSTIAQTIIDSGAEIVVILEVYSKGTAQGISKQVKLGDSLATASAKASVGKLLIELNTQQPASNWKSKISGVNAGNEDRDSYAYFWKTKTSGGALGLQILPTDITLVTGPDLLLTDSNGKPIAGRRPAYCIFQLDNAKANPPTQKVIACGFHADASFNNVPAIKKSIIGCVSAANLVANFENDIPIVIGGDLNFTYNGMNKPFYDDLDEKFNFETALTDGTGSSLLAKPDFTVMAPVLARNAYDNILYKDVSLLANPPARVINVVEKIADKLPQKDKKGQKRDRAELEEEAFRQFYTKDNTTTSSISDHFPVVGAFGFE